LELLLNLLWVLLLLPAYWIWRQSQCASRSPRVHSRHSLLLVGCVVLLLFPIISASDDLQAMRPEVEEFATPDARHAQSGRHSSAADNLGAWAAPAQSVAIHPHFTCVGLALTPALALGHDPVQAILTGRSPPASSLA